jgi:hypothetical protein
MVAPDPIPAEPAVSAPLGLLKPIDRTVPQSSDEVYLGAALAMWQWADVENSTDLFEWHKCGGCQAPGPCSCSGVPYPSGPVRAAVDAARAPLLAENADLRAKLEAVDVLAPVNQHVRRLRRELDAQQHALLETVQVEALEQRTRAESAEAERDEARRLAALTAEQEAANAEIIVATRADLAEARAVALPEGGQWVTLYAVDNGQPDLDRTALWRMAGADCPFPGVHNVQRRAWYGPVEPVTETEAGDG